MVATRWPSAGTASSVRRHKSGLLLCGKDSVILVPGQKLLVVVRVRFPIRKERELVIPCKHLEHVTSADYKSGLVFRSAIESICGTFIAS
jgi:hypothetical protein